MQPESGSAPAANRLPYYCPVVFALILPILIGTSKPPILNLYSDLFYVFIGLLPAVVIIRIVYDCTVKNEAFVICFFRFLKPLKYLENLPAEIILKTDHKKFKFPWATMTLAACNTVIYFTVPGEIAKGFYFAPYWDPSLPHILISVFTCAFLHVDTAHLFGNMIYLVVFGSLVESKIGSIRFLTVFFLCLIASAAADVAMLKYQNPGSSLMPVLKDFHSLGASGAIAGIMGLFIVRCFFVRFRLCCPFISLPFLTVPIGICGTLLISSLFASDVWFGLKMFPSSTGIDHWAHLGGCIGGLVLGYCLRLHRDASREALEMKAEALIHKKTIRKGGRLHVAALKFLLERYKNDRKKGEFYFVRLIRVLTGTNSKKAIEIFQAYDPNYVKALPGNILMDIGLHFYRTGDLNKAENCLRLAACKNDPLQSKAKLYLARTLKLKQEVK